MTVGVLVACVALLAGALFGGTADAKKKKKKKGGPVNVTKTVNQQIPDRGPLGTDPFGRLDSTIAVTGKKFNGRIIRDVNVTLQTTGNNAASAGDLLAEVTAPNGASVFLFLELEGQSVGPMTLDDETVNIIGGSGTATVPELQPPYAGSARPGAEGFGAPMATMDFGPVKGNWTLHVFDTDGTPAGITSILNSWSVSVATGGPLPS
jgi:subtilisin-like proprotein convertase family protein